MSVPCPKCGADSDDVGSKYVCGDCYWVFDKGGGLGLKPRAVVDVPTPQRPTLSQPPPRAPMPVPVPVAPPSAPAPVSAAPTVCPKCSGNLVNIAGKPVCEKCFHTVDIPDSPPVQQALAPSSPSNPQAPSPSSNPQALPSPTSNQGAALPIAPAATTPSAAAGSLGVCPKCSGQLMDIGGKLVCGDCYHVVDSPSSKPAAKGPISIMPLAAAPVAAGIPTVCPKCSGKLMDVSGRYVCDACYHVVDTPNTPSKARGNLTPQPVEPTEEGQLSPQMIGGISLILLLILMIVVLAIRH